MLVVFVALLGIGLAAAGRRRCCAAVPVVQTATNRATVVVATSRRGAIGDFACMVVGGGAYLGW